MPHSHEDPNPSSHAPQDDSPSLQVTVQGTVRSVYPSPDAFDDLDGIVESADTMVDLNLVHFDRWAYEASLSLIDAVKRWEANAALRISVDGRPATSPFDAILDALTTPRNVAEREQFRSIALYAIAAFHASETRSAAQHAATRLRQLGYGGRLADQLHSEAEQLLGQLEGTADPEELDEVLADAPIDFAPEIPRNWNIGADGVRRLGSEPYCVAPAPILLVARDRNIHSGQQFVTVAWFCDGRWFSHSCPRGVIATSRAIVELANFGCPVNSNVAAGLVQWLAEFEAANSTRLPMRILSGQMGWQNHGELGFLCGELHIPAIDESTDVTTPSAVAFQPADVGNQAVVAGLKRKGSLPKWIDAVRSVSGLSRVMFTLYASFASVLIEILGASNFAVDIAGETSCGKTTALRLAASVWGNPDETSSGSVVSSWDSTRVGVERRCDALRNIPTILDDTKTARDKPCIEQVLYEFVSGHGRIRGSEKGLAATGTWKACLISSGESPLTAYSKSGGTRARTLELWGSPFADSSPATACLVNELNFKILNNYGHAGPAFVEFLLANREQWPTWRDHHAHLKSEFTECAEDSITARKCEAFATISLAAILVDQAFDSQWEAPDVIDDLWDELTEAAGEARPANRALKYVEDWSMANNEKFIPPNHCRSKEPSNGWVGRFLVPQSRSRRPSRSRNDWHVVAFFPHQLERILREGGFDEFEAIVRAWNDNGWLETSENRSRYRVRNGDSTSWMIAIRRQAIDELAEASTTA